jgi:hypothetical protein
MSLRLASTNKPPFAASCCSFDCSSITSVTRNHHQDIMGIFLHNLDLAKLCKAESAPRKKDTIFPIKLHRMLQYVEREGLDYIVSWHPDGRSFQVQCHDQFVTRVLPGYFSDSQTRYRSFQRQLSHYGFERIAKGSYRHPSFVRDNPTLCEGMTRRERRLNVKKPSTIAPSSAAEPMKTTTEEEGATIPPKGTMIDTSRSSSKSTASSSFVPESTSAPSSEPNVVPPSPEQMRLLLKLPEFLNRSLFFEEEEEEPLGKDIVSVPHVDSFEDLCEVLSSSSSPEPTMSLLRNLSPELFFNFPFVEEEEEEPLGKEITGVPHVDTFEDLCELLSSSGEEDEISMADDSMHPTMTIWTSAAMRVINQPEFNLSF